MAIPKIGVHSQRLRSEVGFGVDPPPLCGEIGQRLSSGVKQIEITKAPAASQVGIKHLSVAFAIEIARAIAIAFAPANRPNGALVPERSFMDAHLCLILCSDQQSAETVLRW